MNYYDKFVIKISLKNIPYRKLSMKLDEGQNQNIYKRSS